MLFESLGLRPCAQWLSRHDWCCAVPVNYLKSESNFEWIFVPLEKEFRVALRFSFVVSCQRFGSSWPSSWKKFIKIIFKGELNKISTLLGALHILEWENLLWRTLPVACSRLYNQVNSFILSIQNEDDDEQKRSKNRIFSRTFT